MKNFSNKSSYCSPHSPCGQRGRCDIRDINKLVAYGLPTHPTIHPSHVGIYRKGRGRTNLHYSRVGQIEPVFVTHLLPSGDSCSRLAINSRKISKDGGGVTVTKHTPATVCSSSSSSSPCRQISQHRHRLRSITCNQGFISLASLVCRPSGVAFLCF